MEDKRMSAPNHEQERKIFNASFEHLAGTEIVGRRSEFVKHYDLGGGRYQMVVFPEPVHFKKDGEWAEIDNTLVDGVDADGNPILRNTENPLRAELAKETGARPMIRLATKGKAIAWSIANQKSGCAARITLPCNDALTDQEKRGQTGKEFAQVTYEGVCPGMDVVYTLHGDQFKEDIILHNAQAAQYAVMQLCDDYYYRVEDDGHVVAEGKNGESTPFAFAAPVAWDADARAIPVRMELFGSRMTYRIAGDVLSGASFPITIDPTVSTSSGIEWATFKSGSAVPADSSYLYSGKNGSSEWATALRIKNLNWDGMRRSDTVTGAYLQLKDRTGKSSNYVAAYQLLADWNPSTVTWDTLACGSAGDVHHERIAPVMLDCKAGGGTVKLDITRAYRDWKDTGKNFGLLLRRPHGMSEGCYMRMRSPVLYVNYMSHAGVAGWWEYAEQDVGRAGTAKVDLFNGNMVFEHADIQMTGNRMPIGVTHYYNSCLSVGGESDDPKVSNHFHCGTGFKMSVQQCVSARKAGGEWFYVWTDGSGLEHWFKKRPSGKESKDLEGMNYTLVYKAKTSSALEQITITDSGHTVMTFKRRTNGKHAQWVNYWLVEVCDSIRRKSGVYNKNVYAYTMPSAATDATAVGQYEGMVKSITDSAGRQVSFAYDANKRLSALSWPGETASNGIAVPRTMNFGYDDSGRLIGVAYHDLQPVNAEAPVMNTVFEYENNLMTAAQNYDGKRVEMRYDYEGIEDGHACNCGCAYCCGALGDSARVKSLEFLAVKANGAAMRGAKQLFAYDSMATTVTAVANAETDDGKKLRYQFNASGNVIGMLDELGYAQFIKFSPNTPNKPTDVSKLQRVVVNRLAPFSEASTWSAANAAVGYVKGGNTRRLLGVPTALVKENGVISQTVSLHRGKMYTASVYAFAATADDTARAMMRIKLDGTLISSDIADVEMMAQDNAIGLSGWARISRTFEMPKGPVDAEVTVELVNGGTQNVWFGWPQLEEGEAANHVNLLYNSDFTKGFSTDTQKITLPSGWSKDKEFALDVNNRAVNLPEDAPAVLGGNCAKITSTPKKSKRKVYQALPIAGAKDSVFTLGGWAKALSLPGEEGKKPYFDIAISFRNKSNKYAKTLYLTFNKAQHDWQYACRAVLAPYEFTAVRVECVYSYNAEYALFTNLFLSREEFGQSFVYDDDKDVVSASDRSSQKTKMKYDKAKNVISYRKPGKDDKVVYTANYGSTEKQQKEHLPRWEKSPEGVVNRYAYDDFGNTKITRTQKSGALGDSDLAMGSATAYTANGMYEATTTDSHGATTAKDYDPTSGRLKSVTDAQGMKAAYSYDGMDRTTEVVAAGDGDAKNVYRNVYTYEKDEIKTISHNTTDPNACDVTYTFDYDAMGRQTSVKVGEQVLAESVYGEDRSGLLKETRFGNGGKVRFEHDDFDRTTGVFYDNEAEPRYRYSYDAEGRVAKVEDKNLNRTAWTEYDLAGRPIRTNHTEANANNDQELFYRTRLGYDKDHSLKEFCETVGNTNHKSVYDYDRDDRMSKMAFGADGSIKGIQYTYDGIGRVSKIARGAASVSKSGKTVTVNSNANLAIAYSYAAGDTAKFGSKATTPLMSKIVHGSNELTFAYTYDATGNILTVKQYSGSTAPTAATIQYQYDKLGQLIRVDDAGDTTSGSSGTTWVYEYDLGGNILIKKRYAYTPGSLTGMTALESIPYTYASAWKDRLDSYGGKPLLYDEIGNLTRFDGNTYEWQAGKQLKRIDMRTAKGASGIDAMDGMDANSGTVLRITFSNGNTLTQENPETKAIARVYRDGKDITDDQTDASFAWTRDSGNAAADAAWAEAHKGMKQIALTGADLNGNVRIRCSLTGESTLYGTVQPAMVSDALANKLTVTHSPNGADENHTFRIEKGSLMLVVPTPEEETPAEDEPDVDLDEVIDPIDADNGELDEVADESGIADEEDIVEPDPEGDEGMENGGTDGDESSTDADVNETDDVIYEEPDNLPNEDAARVPKGVRYVLEEGHLRVPIELNGTITATATVYSDLPDQALEFKYDVNGLRTQKKLTRADKTTVTTDYILHGDQVNHVTITEADANGTVTATNNLHFYYDAANRPIALDYNGTKYFYAHNVHNDIAAILDSNGNIVVEYKYNAWGELLATTGTYASTLGKLNPFRYRGYVYDEESGLYYLRNRYYNPELQRFINADDVEIVEIDQGTPLQYNLFSYCHNNPINMTDDSGCLPFFLAAGAVGAVIGGIAGAIATHSWKGALAGAAIGGATFMGLGAGFAALVAGKATASVGAVCIGTRLFIAGIGQTGYASYKAWKAAQGAAGDGRAWHHIVEQTAYNMQQFGARIIQNARNIVNIPHGKGTIHNAISALYSSIQDYSAPLTVRKWLSTQSYRAQYNFGLETLAKYAKEFGVKIFYSSRK